MVTDNGNGNLSFGHSDGVAAASGLWLLCCIDKAANRWPGAKWCHSLKRSRSDCHCQCLQNYSATSGKRQAASSKQPVASAENCCNYIEQSSWLRDCLSEFVISQMQAAKMQRQVLMPPSSPVWPHVQQNVTEPAAECC